MIKVENVSKEFQLGVIGKKELNVKVGKAVDKIFDSTSINKPERKRKQQELYKALSDISFDVHAGETVGIIGHNGAGKSTLLKLITRITLPTSGRIYLNGHVASMIEVGTGFHPELTGRENIYLNGAILGMGMKEIDCKLEDIIDFSECRKFIDTPVKHYSSGMYLKLGFAVAAFLDAEIVIMDEVLAVGDTAFRSKCMHKLKEISLSGKTILFVSHNMDQIRSLCGRCILLSQGEMLYDGDVETAIQKYVSDNSYIGGSRKLDDLQRPVVHRISRMAWMTYIELQNSGIIAMGNSLCFSLRFLMLRTPLLLTLRVGIWSSSGLAVGVSFAKIPMAHEGENEIHICMDTSRLTPGVYSLELILVEPKENRIMEKLDALRDVVTFEISIPVDRPAYQEFNRDWGYMDLPMQVN